MNDPRIRKWLERVRQGRWDTTRHNNLHVPKREILRRLPWRPVVIGGAAVLAAPIIAEAWYDVCGKSWDHPLRVDRAVLLKKLGSEVEDPWKLELLFLSTVKFLTTTNSGEIPSDCTTASEVHLIGAGSNGEAGVSDSNGAGLGRDGGTGGAGGAWSYKANVSGIAPSDLYVIPGANTGTDANFKSGIVVADSATGTGANKGLASLCTGDAKANGGAGGAAGAGASNTDGSGGGGGGGAGGPGTLLAGAVGQDGVAGSSGGGASGGGGAGGKGDNPSGGAGGTGGSGGANNATAGSDGAEFSQTSPANTKGSGGGGGGGCGGISSSQTGKPGKNGGSYGAGGGAGGGAFTANFSAGGAFGSAAQGFGALVYTPAGGGSLVFDPFRPLVHMLTR